MKAPSLRPVAALAFYLEIERIPPEPIIGFCDGAPAIGLSERQIFEQAVRMKLRQRLLHAMRVLG
jgi:hypothetical protein